MKVRGKIRKASGRKDDSTRADHEKQIAVANGLFRSLPSVLGKHLAEPDDARTNQPATIWTMGNTRFVMVEIVRPPTIETPMFVQRAV